MRALVIGGYGTFGSLVSRELARRGVDLAIAGRDLGKAERFAAALGQSHRALSLDLADGDACRRAIREAEIAIHCAGPFGGQPTTVAEACLAEGRPYVDIAEDRDYVARIRGLSDRFRERGISGVYGASSLPGLSGALALVLAGCGSGPSASRPLESVKVRLVIGNRNPKGWAATVALVSSVGRPFPAPQGRLLGLGDPEAATLPEPFGRRLVANFESPEYDLLGRLVGARRIEVKVGFELPGAIRFFSLLSRLGARPGRRTARLVALAAAPLSGVGHSGGCVQVECADAQGRVRTGSIGGAEDGQRMASLPAVLAAIRLLEGAPPGIFAPYEVLGARPLLDAVGAEGFRLSIGDDS